jgi:hypothetical protein
MHRHRNNSYVTAVIPLFRATGLQIKCYTHTQMQNKTTISVVRHPQFDRLSHDSGLSLYTSVSDNSLLQLHSVNHGKQ